MTAADTDRDDAAQSRDPAAEVAAGFPVTDRPSWIMLAGVGLLVLVAIGWAVFGSTPDAVNGVGIVTPNGGFRVVGQATSGTVDKVFVRAGQTVTQGQPVVTLINDRGKPEVVKSPTTGRVASVNVRPGSYTTQGQSLITMLPLARDDVVVSFMPAGPAKQVQEGMRALVEVESVPRSQYGDIEGTVLSISPVPVSRARILLMVGDNESLADYFLSKGPVLEVTVRLTPNPTTPSGYEWTVGSGPPAEITEGTLARVSVILAEEAPWERIL